MSACNTESAAFALGMRSEDAANGTRGVPAEAGVMSRRSRSAKLGKITSCRI